MSSADSGEKEVFPGTDGMDHLEIDGVFGLNEWGSNRRIMSTEMRLVQAYAEAPRGGLRGIPDSLDDSIDPVVDLDDGRILGPFNGFLSFHFHVLRTST